MIKWNGQHRWTVGRTVGSKWEEHGTDPQLDPFHRSLTWRNKWPVCSQEIVCPTTMPVSNGDLISSLKLNQTINIHGVGSKCESKCILKVSIVKFWIKTRNNHRLIFLILKLNVQYGPPSCSLFNVFSFLLPYIMSLFLTSWPFSMLLLMPVPSFFIGSLM